jgi:hypothetical protein
VQPGPAEGRARARGRWRSPTLLWIDPEDDRPEAERARALCLYDDDSEEWIDTECLGEILAWLEGLPTPPPEGDERP